MNKQESIAKLNLSPNTTIYTLVRHVARSGMSRHVSLFRVVDGEIQDITFYVANILGEKRAPNGGIKVSGCGFNAGFSLVYDLGSVVWPEGTPKPHGTRNGKPDSSGGYALKQEEL